MVAESEVRVILIPDSPQLSVFFFLNFILPSTGFKDALIATLTSKYLISPSSATIFTSELPSNLSPPLATGANPPQPQLQPSSASHVNPLLLAATTASIPALNPASSVSGFHSSHQHSSSHGQT